MVRENDASLSWNSELSVLHGQMPAFVAIGPLVAVPRDVVFHQDGVGGPWHDAISADIVTKLSRITTFRLGNQRRLPE
ncbi:MAG: hypothetical protein WDO73_01645 [Ignavibacteriota bacterium]